jgi:hypothetical protein
MKMGGFFFCSKAVATVQGVLPTLRKPSAAMTIPNGVNVFKDQKRVVHKIL